MKWVALLRGVNVGGGNKVPMAQLRAQAEGLGWRDVATYIASGNMVFRADGAAEPLAQSLRAVMDVDVPVRVIAAPDFAEILAGCPFEPEAGKHVHGMMFWQEPVVDQALVAELKSDEELCVVGQTLWLHTPSGFSTSKLAAKIGRITGGAPMTARNLNTFHKLVEMLDALGAD